MSKVYDDPKYNAAFDRCVDVMARLLQKYGPQSNPFLCIRNLTKPLDIN